MRLNLPRWSGSGEGYGKAFARAIVPASSQDRWLRVNALHRFGR